MIELRKRVEKEQERLVDMERQMTEQAVREAVDSAMARLPKDVQGKENFRIFQTKISNFILLKIITKL